jgi:hypothetical protein
VRTRTIGATEVGAIGLGEMQLSLADRPDEARAVATIHAALDDPRLGRRRGPGADRRPAGQTPLSGARRR